MSKRKNLGVLLAIVVPLAAAAWPTAALTIPSPPATHPSTTDPDINVYQITRTHPLADNATHNAPVTATNPVDPKKDEDVWVISVADGRFLISQFPNAPSRHLAFKWEVDTRRPDQKYDYYRDPLNAVDSFADPFKKALAFATYKKIYELPRGLGLLSTAALTDTQLTQEKIARDVMEAEIALRQEALNDGTFQPTLLADVFNAMKAYDATPGTERKDQRKAAAARQILEAATKYLNALQDEQDKSIDKYIMALDKLLSDDQKQRVIAAYQQYLQRATRPARGTPVTRPPATAPTPG